MTHRRRIWSETLPLAELSAPATLALLARRRIELIAAVRPWDLDVVPSLVRACAEAGVTVGLWPMIDDAHGRWAGAANMRRFRAFAETLLDALPRDAPVLDLVVDLELPFGLVTTAMRSPTAVWPAPGSGEGWTAARAELRGLLDVVHARGFQCSAAVLPFVLLDPTAGRLRPVQRALSTPVDGLPWDHVNVMAYTSLFEGWSLRTVNRSRARAALRWCASAVVQRFGPSAGVSLGVVDVGALGDEPRYRAPDELADDVRIAVDAGAAVVNLFDLGGVLRRGPPEAWLDAFEVP